MKAIKLCSLLLAFVLLTLVLAACNGLGNISDDTTSADETNEADETTRDGGKNESATDTSAESESTEETSDELDKSQGEQEDENQGETVLSTFNEADWRFELNDNETEYCVRYYIGTDTVVAIPATYRDLPVTAIGENAFKGCHSMFSITIPESVTSIHSNAFSDSTKLVEVVNHTGSPYHSYFPYALDIHRDSTSHLVKIDDFLFLLPNGSNVSIPLLVGYLGTDSAITLPSSFRGKSYNIGRGAFNGCKRLTSVVIPEGVSDLSSGAFSGCYNLTSVTIHAKLNEIQPSVFQSCYKLVEIINHSDATIESRIDVESGVAVEWPLVIHQGTESLVDNVDGFLFYTIEGTPYLLGYAGEDTNITLPADYKGESYRMYPYAFWERDDLTGVTFSEATKLENIAPCAFGRCFGLTEINLTGGFTEIGRGAFARCRGLYRVIIGDQVTHVGESAFEYCDGLVSITFGRDVTDIQENSFYNCNKLTEIINLSSMDANDYIFYALANRALFVQHGNSESIIKEMDGFLFYERQNVRLLLGCTDVKVRHLVLPESYMGQTYGVRSYAFYNCRDIVSVTIPAAVTFFGDQAFSRSADHLSAVYITDLEAWCQIEFSNSFSNNLSNPLSQAEHLYLNGTLVTNLVIPESITVIWDGAFCGASIQSVTLHGGITSIGEMAFGHCNRLTEVTIPSSVEIVDQMAFYSCESLTSVTIEEGVAAIGMNAFDECHNLTVATFEDPNEWWYIDENTGDPIVVEGVSDPSTAARLLQNSTRYSYLQKGGFPSDSDA